MKKAFSSIFTTPKPDLILYSITVFFVLFFIWASVSELEEVTRGNGKVIASSKVQVIQNLEGGIVRDLYVKIGQKVQENEVLLIERSFKPFFTNCITSLRLDSGKMNFLLSS